MPKPRHCANPIITNIALMSHRWRSSGGAAVWSVRGCWTSPRAHCARIPELANFQGRVSDSGEGRWTIHAAIDEGVPAPVMSAALYSRFESRGNADYANRMLSAMRFAFGGHVEKQG